MSLPIVDIPYDVTHNGSLKYYRKIYSVDDTVTLLNYIFHNMSDSLATVENDDIMRNKYDENDNGIKYLCYSVLSVNPENRPSALKEWFAECSTLTIYVGQFPYCWKVVFSCDDGYWIKHSYFATKEYIKVYQDQYNQPWIKELMAKKL